MNTPTSRAPHIWFQVFLKISASCLPLTRNISATLIHDTKMAEPPTAGLKSKTAAMVVFSVNADLAETTRCSQVTPGSDDHGPVHATTTAISTMIGIQPWSTSPTDMPWFAEELWPPAIGAPP